jgi:hypothetical protein
MENTIDLVASGKLLEVKVSGKLTKESYAALVPSVDDLIREHGKIRILFQMHDFHGWTAGALWEDTKFDLSHWRDIERLAIVGETKWQHGMAVFCKPFTSAKIQYFDHAQLDEAKAWIEADE